jgi:hypothetical protein
MRNNRMAFLGLIALGLVGCGAAAGSAAAPGIAALPEAVGQGTTPVVSTPGHEFSSRTASRGTTVEVTLRDEISSREHFAGHALEGSVSRDVVDERGHVVIPAGSGVALEITRISPSRGGDSRDEGTLELAVNFISVNGTSHASHAIVSDIPHTMKGRGETRGPSEGPASGAAAGVVPDTQRDIVVAPGTRIVFALPHAVTVR